MPSSVASSDSDLVVSLTRSGYAERLLKWDGEAYSLRDYPMFQAIYNTSPKRLLLKTCRQVGKSMTLAAFSLAESVAIPHFKTFFIAPTKEQTQTFSTARIGKFVSFSPLVRDVFISPSHPNRVLARHFAHGSRIVFSYASDDADRCRGQSCDRLCFDYKTEVLTRTGWVAVADLTLAHEVADVDDAGVIEWNRPQALIRKTYTGPMVRFKHRAIDIRVTEDHRMWANFRVANLGTTRIPDTYRFVRASELASQKHLGFRFRSSVLAPKTPTPKTITLTAIEGAKGKHAGLLTLPAKPFAELVGWFVSEGSLSWRKRNGARVLPRTKISQNLDKYAEKMEACIKACGLAYSSHRTLNPPRKDGERKTHQHFCIHDPRVANFFRPQGLSRTKHIPPMFFEHPELLEILLESLYLGDAMKPKYGTWREATLCTRSRQLANDVQRAWALLGWGATVYTASIPAAFSDRMAGKNGEDFYHVHPVKLKDCFFWRKDYVTKARVTTEHVENEQVYCFTVKNHRPVVRGGFGQKQIVTGQCMDEVQDILLDVVRPVVVECLRTSKYSYETYCGTPKTFENGIEAMWAGSTQTEWVIKCEACNRSSILMSEKQCGKYGPVCLSCQAYLNPRNGTWVDMNYRPADEDGIVTQTKGFHISRLMMPQNVPAAWPKGSTEWTDALVKWRDVLNALDGPEAYPISTFRNEVLGVSDSQGRRLVTKEMLEKAQTGPAICNKPTKALIQGINKIAVGIDWSGGGSSTTGKDGAVVIKSRTVLAIVGMSGLDSYRLLYYKIFPGTSPVEEFEDICEAIKYYDLATNHKMHIGCDAGEGNMGADMLRHRLVSKGNVQRIIKFRYSGTAIGYASRNPKDGSVTINRTASLDTLMMRFVSQDIEFPKEPDKIMEVPFKDILAEYEEVVGQSMGSGRKVWRHAPTQPDDFLHALNFAVLAAQFAVGKLRLTPHHEED